MTDIPTIIWVLLGLAVWLGNARAIALAASTLNRSVIEWAIFALFFGPVATVAFNFASYREFKS